MARNRTILIGCALLVALMPLRDEQAPSARAEAFVPMPAEAAVPTAPTNVPPSAPDPPRSATGSSRDDDACRAFAARPPSNGDDPQVDLTPWSMAVVRALDARADPLATAVATLIPAPNEWDPAKWTARVDDQARRATTTRDPALYASTLSACRARDQALPGTDSHCGALSVTQYDQLAPDHLRTWLDAARRASAGHDAAGVAGALHHAVSAPLGNTHLPSAVALFESAVPADMPPWVHVALLRRLFDALDEPFGWSALHIAYDFAAPCIAKDIDDPNLRALCRNVATRLIEERHDQTMLWAGLMIAEAMTLPEARLLAARRAAFAFIRSGDYVPGIDEAACGKADDGLTLLLALGAAAPLDALRAPTVIAARERMVEAREQERRQRRSADPDDAAAIQEASRNP